MTVKKRINIITFGCAKNVYDSEILAGYLKNNGLQVVHEGIFKKNDILIVNTCGFIKDAKQESIENVLEYVDMKKKGEIAKIYVVGCLSERYLSDLKKEIPEVDGFLGLNYTSCLAELLNSPLKTDLLGERILSTPPHYAYLKISDGCDHRCAFCAIPLIKGKFRSLSMEELIFQAKKLAEKGVKELIIIAQDTTYYGVDIYGKRKLAFLLDSLSEVNGIEWIRLQYTYPAGFPDDVIELIARNPKICKYIDIPFQHISDRMLHIMKRGINKKGTLDLIDKIRKKIPDVALRSTMIVGHPEESNDDFNELLDFVQQTRFDRLGVFSYSHEESTASYKMEDNVPLYLKKKRLNRILNLQREISNELNNHKIGKTCKVIIDRKEGEHYIGRTEFDTPDVDNEVIINSGDRKLRIGNFYTIKILEAAEYDLFGELA
jgi:ribosomal protein S12 methylthiotransferase